MQVDQIVKLVDEQVEARLVAALEYVRSNPSSNGNGHAVTTAPVKRGPGRPKAEKSAEGASPARVLQGQYMGALRALSASDKAKVKKTRASDGMKAAIRLAKALRKDA